MSDRVARSASISRQFSRLSFQPSHRPPAFRRLEQVSFARPSSNRQRTSRTASGSHADDGAPQPRNTGGTPIPSRNGKEKDPGKRKPYACAPCCKAWKGHLIKPVTALNELRTPEKTTPAANPKAPNMIGKGASGRLPVRTRNPRLMSVPTAPPATAQVSPIPIAPRRRPQPPLHVDLRCFAFSLAPAYQRVPAELWNAPRHSLRSCPRRDLV
jgi:hypothetical protein